MFEVEPCSTFLRPEGGAHREERVSDCNLILRDVELSLLTLSASDDVSRVIVWSSSQSLSVFSSRVWKRSAHACLKTAVIMCDRQLLEVWMTNWCWEVWKLKASRSEKREEIHYMRFMLFPLGLFVFFNSFLNINLWPQLWRESLLEFKLKM